MRKAGVLALAMLVCSTALGGPAEAVAAALADARRLPPADAAHARYLWLPQPAGKGRQTFRTVLGFHANLLSREGDVTFPATVAPDLVRVDLRDYRWDAKVYDKLADVDVFFHAVVEVEFGHYRGPGKARWVTTRTEKRRSALAPWLPGKETAELVELTGGKAPVLDAEWFFVQTARQVSLRNVQEGAGYYNFLGLKDRDAYFKLIGLDVKLAEKLQREIYGAVDHSGISQQNRLVIEQGAVSGPAWRTLDTFTQQGKGVVKRNLKPGEFKHDVEEHYGRLPNNLFVTFLCNEQGVAQESAPDKVGPDDSPLRVGHDPRVHANLSCIRCHNGQVLKPVDDWVRRTFRGPFNPRSTKALQSPDKRTFLDLRRLYFSDLPRALTRDREDYRAAMARAAPGMTAKEISDAYGRAWNDYVETGVDAAAAARELGTTEAHYLAALRKYAETLGGQDNVLADHLDDPPGRIPRLDWEDSYALAQTIIRGYVPK